MVVDKNEIKKPGRKKRRHRQRPRRRVRI